MDNQYLESSETIDDLFPGSLHKTKFCIFQIISKWSIHILIPFKYNNTCDLCDTILYKDKRGVKMVKTCFFFHEEVIDVFHDKFYISTI